MRLAEIIIRNYKAIEFVSIIIPKTNKDNPGSGDFVSLVGMNNAGKSSILEAIALACPGNSNEVSIDHFNFHDVSKPIEIEFRFEDLTEIDKVQHAITARIVDEQYRVKKRWEKPGKTFSTHSYQPAYSFPEMPSTKPSIQSDAFWGPILLEYSVTNPVQRMNAAHKEAMDVLARSLHPSTGQKWIENPGGISANLDAILPQVVYVHAIKETEDEVKSDKSKSTIRQIVNLLFKDYLSKHEFVKIVQSATLEIGTLFDEISKNKYVKDLERRISEKLRRMIDLDAVLRFESADVTEDLAGKTELKIQDGTLVVSPLFQGHGAQRTIVLSLLDLYAELSASTEKDAFKKNVIFLIEEPEIYLHPEMCRKMKDTLLSIARNGVATVICTTHSPVFLDLADRHDGIAIVSRKANNATQIKQVVDQLYPASDQTNGRERLRMLLNFCPSVNEVFFSKKVTLVEGECEIAAIDAVADNLANDGTISISEYQIRRREVVLVNCFGKWTIPAFQLVLNSFGITYRVVHDQDTGKGAAVEKANEVISKLATCKEDVLVHDPNFERHCFNEEWVKDKPWKVRTKVVKEKLMNDRIKKFFEFSLFATIESMKPKVKDNNIAEGSDFLDYLPKCRDKRDKILKIRNTDLGFELSSIDQLEHFVLSAGPFKLTDSASCKCLGTDKNRFLATVRGNSMNNTLFDGDCLVLESLNHLLDRAADLATSVSLSDFSSVIQDDCIYAIAMNETYDDGQYTLKRVKIIKEANNTWHLQILADNPECFWGDRGLRVIRKSDKVHFAAKVVGIVVFDKQIPPAEEPVEEPGL